MSTRTTASSPALVRERRPSGLPRPAGPGVFELLRIGARGVAARRLRSTLSAIGIAIGIAAMVAVLAISDSSRASLLASLDRLGTNLLTVSPGQSFLGDDTALPDEAPSMIRRIAPVQAATSTTAIDATVRRTDWIDSGETGGISVWAAETTLLDTLGATVRLGRFLDAASEQFPTVVLGAVAAERLGINDLDVALTVWLGGQWFRVIGILDPLPLAPELDRAAIVGMPAARTFLDATTAPTTILVRVDPSQIDDVRAVLGATANPQNPEAVQVQRPSDALEARAAAASAFTALFLGLGSVALGVGGLGIANVMLMAVLERRGEIGLRRALGATRPAIAGQFLVEAVVLAVLGGVLGVATGTIIAAAYADSQGWPIVISIVGVAIGVGATVLIGALAGLYPALRAAILPPTDALRAS
ncbi:MAG: ABC transporter permease [Chloroflexi bacterium]|nr:ABC transporter permease [Chloroflexota bacterium]